MDEPSVLNLLAHMGDWHLPKDSSTPDESLEEADVVLADPSSRRPPMYAVVLFNDDYTPMEFVVYVLQKHFKHAPEAAYNIMMTVHLEGKGVAGVFPKEIAEGKAKLVNDEARLEGHPLLCQIEPLRS